MTIELHERPACGGQQPAEVTDVGATVTFGDACRRRGGRASYLSGESVAFNGGRAGGESMCLQRAVERYLPHFEIALTLDTRDLSSGRDHRSLMSQRDAASTSTTYG